MSSSRIDEDTLSSGPPGHCLTVLSTVSPEDRSQRSSSTAHELCVALLQVSRPRNGKDVKLRLVVSSQTNVPVQLSISIHVQAMRHNGAADASIQTELKDATLPPGEGDLLLLLLLLGVL